MMYSTLAKLAFLLSLLVQPLITGQTCDQRAATPARPLAITHVSVIDTNTGSARTDLTVVIRDGRIAGMESANTMDVPRDAQQIDGHGKYLIPGLWDMHVHLSYASASALPIFVANGVTGVRDLGSHLAELDDWRARINAGIMTGPRIIRAGPMLNGRSSNPFQLLTVNPEQARGIVRALKQVGVDLIKIHRRVPRDAYFAIMEEAKAQGLQVVGHVPMTVRPDEASDAGQLIEHIETIFEGTFSANLAPQEELAAIRAFRMQEADALFARFARNHTSVTPALVGWRSLFDSPALLADPNLRYVPRSLREAARKAAPIPEEEVLRSRQINAEFRQLVGMMNRAGVMLLAGTDTSVAPRIPGFWLHMELEALVDAGLTPAQALKTATLNPAKVLKREGDFGNVETGKLADLVLLDANPLDDIHNTRRIAAVVLGGKLLRRKDLDALLKAAEEMANQN